MFKWLRSRSYSTIAPTATSLKSVHTDERRTISESVMGLSDGSCCRIGLIQVSPEATQALRLGDHYHPGDETFVILAGAVQLYTAPVSDPTSICQQRLCAGDTINIPPHVIHTFACEPGTQLQSIANQPFSDRWIVAAKLDLGASV